MVAQKKKGVWDKMEVDQCDEEPRSCGSDAMKRRKSEVTKTLWGDVEQPVIRRASEHKWRAERRTGRARQKLTSTWFTRQAESSETTALLRHNDNQRFGLCACIVVHNEADTIVSTLDRLRVGAAIDCAIVVDTGFDAGTITLVTRYLERHALPGRVVQWPRNTRTDPDIDRGEARTFALRQCAGVSYFTLMLDADAHLHGHLDFFAASSAVASPVTRQGGDHKARSGNEAAATRASTLYDTEDRRESEAATRLRSWRELYEADRVHAYLLRFGQKNGERFWRPAVFRNDGSWRYQYAVHEMARTERADPVMLSLHGSAHPAKDAHYYIELQCCDARGRDPRGFERDAERLLRDHTRDPGDVHHIHFLAQSHRDAGDRVQALAWYRKYARALEASLPPPTTPGTSASEPPPTSSRPMLLPAPKSAVPDSSGNVSTTLVPSASRLLLSTVLRAVPPSGLVCARRLLSHADSSAFSPGASAVATSVADVSVWMCAAAAASQ